MNPADAFIAVCWFLFGAFFGITLIVVGLFVTARYLTDKLTGRSNFGHEHHHGHLALGVTLIAAALCIFYTAGNSIGYYIGSGING